LLESSNFLFDATAFSPQEASTTERLFCGVQLALASDGQSIRHTNFFVPRSREDDDDDDNGSGESTSCVPLICCRHMAPLTPRDCPLSPIYPLSTVPRHSAEPQVVSQEVATYTASTLTSKLCGPVALGGPRATAGETHQPKASKLTPALRAHRHTPPQPSPPPPSAPWTSLHFGLWQTP